MKLPRPMPPVHLVGAGPGDPELLTLKGKRLLEAADAVLYDALAPAGLLQLAPAAAERCYVGKRAGDHALSQAEIGAWLVERARCGLKVVRLKGGDPLVFARGGEEMAALRRAGVPFEVVPGVTAATAAAAAARVPLTHRDLAPGVRFVSGPGLLAAPPPPSGVTLAIFMGLEKLEAITRALLAQGWSRRVMAAAVERASLPGQRVIAAPLPRIAACVRAAGLSSPVLVLVGEVVALRRQRPSRRSTLAREPLPGMILMAHGSPLDSWQRGVRKLARELARPGQFSRAAFLPPVRPGLGEAAAAAAAAGVRRLAVVPYFLAPGLHVSRDLPQLVAAARRRFPKLRIALAPCLDGHPALRTAVLARAAQAFRAES